MKKLITEDFVIAAAKRGEKELVVCKNCVITPLAHDKIKSLGMAIVDESQKTTGSTVAPLYNLRVIIGGDHTGFAVRKIISNFLKEKGIVVEDAGSYSEDACDYPDFAKEVARAVKTKGFDFGIVVDATGIPSCITANKFKGIRAATCYNEFSARSAREHNNANILALGAKTLGEETIKSILNTWLSAEFLGDRHQKRLDKISKIEELNFRS